MNSETYWKDLVSYARRELLEQDNALAVFVIQNGELAVELNNHDNWNGGIDYWDIIFQLEYRDYKTIANQKDELEAVLDTALSKFHSDDRDFIANVLIRPKIKRFIDWHAILPTTKEDAISIIEEEKNLLTEIATGRSFKEDGIEEEYMKRHCQICTLAQKAGFEYPVSCESLVVWWEQVKHVGGYSDRRVYIAKMFAPLLSLLRESDESPEVDFSRILTRAGVVHKALDDVLSFIREGKYDSAVDRVHTVFHGYLRQLLTAHGVEYSDDDSLPALYTKLHSIYERIIQPPDVGERVKTILRSAGGMLNAVNELRNNNTVAHPNGQLIQRREAQLVIRLCQCSN